MRILMDRRGFYLAFEKLIITIENLLIMQVKLQWLSKSIQFSLILHFIRHFFLNFIIN